MITFFSDLFDQDNIKLFDSNNLNFDLPEIGFEGFNNYDELDFNSDESGSEVE